MRIEFLLSTGINLYSFGHKERVDLFVCFPLKCERTSAYNKSVRPTGFRFASTVTLCYKHVFAMSSRKIRGKSH